MSDNENKPEEHVPDEVKAAREEGNFSVSTSDIPGVQESDDENKGDEKPKSDGEKPEAKADPDPAPQADPGDEDDGKAKAKDDEDGKGKTDPSEAWNDVPEGVRKRVARQNRKLRETSDENAELRARIEALEAGQKAEPDPQPKELDPDDFDTYEEYQEAKAEQKVEAKTKAKEKPEPKPDPAQTFKADHGIDLDTFNDAQSNLQEAIETEDPDLWEEASASRELKISPSLVASLAETQNPAKVLREIMGSDDKGAAFSKMTPFQQARELAKLDAGGKEPAKPAKKTTNAPEPIEPVNSRGRPMGKEYADMDQGEFEKRRAEEEKSGSGGRFDFM